MCVQSSQSGHTFSAALLVGKGEGGTVSLSYKIYVQLSKNTEEQARCFEEV